MEVKCGQAVCYLDERQRERWLLVETVLSIQITGSQLLCRELVSPQDLAKTGAGSDAGKYTGLNEVYVSSKEVTVQRSQVLRTSQISDLQTYAKVRQGLVWRRRLKPDTGMLEPPFLSPICVCKEPLNPDVEYVCCDACAALIHEKCLIGADCPLCKNPYNSRKRPASPLNEPPVLKAAKSEAADPLVLERKPSHILQVSKYPLLNMTAGTELQNTLNRLAEESQHLQSSLSEEDKVRQNLKDKVLGALLLSQFESKSQGSGTPHEFKDLVRISIEVEAALYFSSSQTVKSTNYGRRARMIVFNLLDEKNPDLRANLLRGQVKPHSMAFMESKDMASSSMKQLREERERQYLEEQLICPNTGAKLIVKTHKGEGVIEMGETERVVNSDTTDLLENLQESRKPAQVQEEEDDPFDPNNHGKEQVKTSSTEKPQTLEVPPPARSPWVQSRIYDIVKENSPEVLAQKIKKRLTQYLKPEQVKTILEAAQIP